MSVFSDNECAFHSGVQKFFEDEGITQVITFTRTNVAKLFIRTMKSLMHDRVRFNRGSWTAMLSKTHSTVYVILHHFLNTLIITHCYVARKNIFSIVSRLRFAELQLEVTNRIGMAAHRKALAILLLSCCVGLRLEVANNHCN